MDRFELIKELYWLKNNLTILTLEQKKIKIQEIIDEITDNKEIAFDPLLLGLTSMGENRWLIKDDYYKYVLVTDGNGTWQINGIKDSGHIEKDKPAEIHSVIGSIKIYTHQFGCDLLKGLELI